MMFKDNKYTKIYLRLIENARYREKPTHIEYHHVIPKSLGGLDESSNIVNLTPREHFVAHHLLTKMLDGEDKMKMCFALHTFFHFNKFRRLNFTARQYEFHKMEFMDACKMRTPWVKWDVYRFKHKDTGEEFEGIRREFIIHSGITEQEANFLFRAAEDSSVPTRWIKGWGVWVDSLNDWSYNKKIKRPPPQKVECEHCNTLVTKGNYKRWHGSNCKQVDIEGHYERTRQVASINQR